MSKIAENKALEAYPFEPIECGGGIADSNSEYRGLYQDGYDQAMQDFLEKAMKYLRKNLLVSDLERREYLCMTKENKDYFIKDFKNHMQDEM